MWGQLQSLAAYVETLAFRIMQLEARVAALEQALRKKQENP